MSLSILLSSSPSPLKRPVWASGKRGAEAKKESSPGTMGKKRSETAFSLFPSSMQLILTRIPFFVRCTSKGTEVTEEGSHWQHWSLEKFAYRELWDIKAINLIGCYFFRRSLSIKKVVCRYSVRGSIFLSFLFFHRLRYGLHQFFVNLFFVCAQPWR